MNHNVLYKIAKDKATCKANYMYLPGDPSLEEAIKRLTYHYYLQYILK